MNTEKQGLNLNFQYTGLLCAFLGLGREKMIFHYDRIGLFFYEVHRTGGIDFPTTVLVHDFMPYSIDTNFLDVDRYKEMYAHFADHIEELKGKGWKNEIGVGVIATCIGQKPLFFYENKRALHDIVTELGLRTCLMIKVNEELECDCLVVDNSNHNIRYLTIPMRLEEEPREDEEDDSEDIYEDIAFSPRFLRFEQLLDSQDELTLLMADYDIEYRRCWDNKTMDTLYRSSKLLKNNMCNYSVLIKSVLIGHITWNAPRIRPKFFLDPKRFPGSENSLTLMTMEADVFTDILQQYTLQAKESWLIHLSSEIVNTLKINVINDIPMEDELNEIKSILQMLDRKSYMMCMQNILDLFKKEFVLKD